MLGNKLLKIKRKFLLLLFIFLFSITAVIFTGCSTNEGKNRLSGEVKINGSSTVYPITEAVAEEFQRENPSVRVTVGVSGTGGGFKRFVAGETDINNASRPIEKEEKEKAQDNNIEYVEFSVAYDGITIVKNPQNNWCNNLTVEQLKKIWQPQSKIQKWSDIDPNWPDKKIVLFGPDTDSGTFDYFTEVVTGEEGASRSDYTASTDDNVLVQGVSGEKFALGYFGYAYFEENENKLDSISINGVKPTFETIKSGKYSPLSRPLLIYVNKESLERPEVKAFVKFYLENAKSLVRDVGYIPLPEEEYEEQLNSIN